MDTYFMYLMETVEMKEEKILSLKTCLMYKGWAYISHVTM